MINRSGVRAEIFYGGAPFEIRRGNEVEFIYEPLTHNLVLQEYAYYDPIPAKSTALSDRTLVILPEIFPELHKMFAPAVTAYWWLGWDAAFRPGSRLTDLGFQSTFFARPDLWHIAQTFRVHVLLREKGARRIVDVVDYVDPRFTGTKPNRHNVVFRVAYNPKRIGAADLANRFFDDNTDIPACPIIGMSREEVHETLRQTMIYVEFGNNPGSDRLPREAASVGCIVLAKNAGGSSYFEDMPIDAEFKFSEQDVRSGRLAQLIRTIAGDPAPYFEAQEFYRSCLRLQREQMMLQTKRLLGLG
jgi:hypothetical protein